MAFSLRNAVAAVALSLALAPAARAQDRDQLPIKVEARSSDFDYQNNALFANDKEYFHETVCPFCRCHAGPDCACPVGE